MSSTGYNRRAGVLGVLLLAGCSGHAPVLEPLLAGQPRRAVELSATPFFPQEDYQCGPAALATALGAAGVAASPHDLVERIYVPGRRGSFRLELLAASRDYGRLPYQIDPRPAALLGELRAGRPVLVLQNLGWERFPVWHYAVVVGYRTDPERLLLRSGRERRLLVPAGEFLDSWQRAAYWGLVLLRPGELPNNPDPDRYLRQAAALEGTTGWDAAAAYEAALRRWPHNSLARLGLGNTLYAQGRLEQAEAEFRALLAAEPGHAAALNNLAMVLAARGCRAEALAVAEAALAGSAGGAFQEAIARTRMELLAGSPGTRRCAPPPP